MTQIVKQCVINQLFGNKDIQIMIKDFIFYTQETSVAKRKIYRMKRIINQVFANRCYDQLSRYPMHLQFVNPVTLWQISISSNYLWHNQKRYNHGLLLTAYFCQRCGDYYTDELSLRRKMSIPTQITCKCYHPRYHLYSQK